MANSSILKLEFYCGGLFQDTILNKSKYNEVLSW